MGALVEPKAWIERQAAQELIRLHRSPSGALQFQNANRAFATGDRQVIIEQGAGLATTPPLRRAQNLDPDRLAVSQEFEPGPRERRKPADMIMDLAPWPPPIDAGFGAVDLGSINNAC